MLQCTIYFQLCLSVKNIIYSSIYSCDPRRTIVFLNFMLRRFTGAVVVAIDHCRQNGKKGRGLLFFLEHLGKECAVFLDEFDAVAQRQGEVYRAEHEDSDCLSYFHTFLQGGR